MADNQKIIAHRRFDAIVDSNYIDTEDIPDNITVLDECENLTPFRKNGSLSQCDGFTEVLAYTGLPNETAFALTGYKPIDWHIFGLDKDSKEIKVIVYSNGTRTRIFITPFWNPNASYSNYSPYNSNAPESWVQAWREITETYTATVQITGANTFTFTTGADQVANANDYFAGWFVVDTSINSTTFVERANKYNYITTHTYSAGTHTCTTKGNMTGWVGNNWANNDSVTLVRFPVTYLYKANQNTLSGAGATFDAIPTDFHYKEGSLRIACGKSNKPLIIQFIENRKYLQGNQNVMSYDGFWFDFQTLPQKMKHSAVTAWATRDTGGGGAAYDICAPAGVLAWGASGTGKVTITPVSGAFTLQIRSVTPSLFQLWSLAGTVIPLIASKVGIWNNYVIVIVDNVTVTQAQFVASYNTGINPLYGISYATASAGDATDFVNVTNTNWYFQGQTKSFVGTTGFMGFEAGKNSLAFNPFIGMSLYMVACTAAAADVQRNALIVNAIYDNRSQLLLGHGTYDTTKGFEIHYNLWFSRRLTGMSLFNQKVGTSGTGNITNPSGVVIEIEQYPYFKWQKDFGASPIVLRINELKHFAQYGIYDFTKGVNGQVADYIGAGIDETTGKNCYTYSALSTSYYRGAGANTHYSHSWYVKFTDTDNQIATDGKGLKYISKCNRYIDQDTSMNYERMSFVGQTNGRYFLIGVKNSIEEETFDSNDVCVYNIYAGAVSEYDTYLRDRYMGVSFGDKDKIRAIVNNNGYLFLSKDANSYALEVNTDNEIKYRVIDTHLGRGVTDPNMLISTPYGIIMATTDGVWMVNVDGTERILRQDNGKLYLYKTLFQSAVSKSIIYSKKHNELLLFLRITNTDVSPNNHYTYVFFYNFDEQKWGGYYKFFKANGSTGVRPILPREDTNNNILFFNYDDTALSNCRIDKFSDTSNVFINTAGTSIPIVWKMKTHLTPYSGRMADTRIQKLDLTYDVTGGASTAGNVIITIHRDNLTDESITFRVTAANSTTAFTNVLKEALSKLQGISSVTGITIENNTSNNFSKFVLNGIYLWIISQPRKVI